MVRWRVAIAVFFAATVLVVGTSATRADAVAIFQVEFRDCRTLHVGYSGGSSSTIVKWRVWQGSAGADGTGAFVAYAGAANRFLTMPLPHRLAPGSDAAVRFVVGSASAVVRRSPGCTVGEQVRETGSGSRSRSSRDGNDGSANTTTNTDAAISGTSSRAGSTPTALAFTGSGPAAIVGGAVALFGAGLLLLTRERRTGRRGRPAPWLVITTP